MTLPRRSGSPVVFSSGAYVVEAVDARSKRIHDIGEHVAFFISPGNAYFSTGRLAVMARWATDRFVGIDMVCGDVPMAASTYLSRGKNPSQAVARARKDVHQMLNRIDRALQAEHIPDHRIRVSLFGDWADHPAYQHAKQRYDAAMSAGGWFAKVHADAIFAAASSHDPNHRPTLEQLHAGRAHLAIAYPLHMIGFEVFGVGTSLTVYPSLEPITTAAFVPGSEVEAAATQGFAALKIPDGQ